MIEILSPAELPRARRSGALVADILQTLRSRTAVGTNLLEIDPGASWPRRDVHEPGPEEVFVVSGVFNDGARDYPAGTFPGQDQALKDDTHHNPYGGYELAKCVVEGMRTNPTLSTLLSESVTPFDPAKPDDVNEFALPASPSTQPTTKPAGS